MMSLTFIAGVLSLLLLPLTCISILYSLQSQPQQSTPTLANNTKHILHSYLTHSHLSSVWKLLLHHSIFPTAKSPATGVRRYDGGEEEGCSVCLCRIQQGEEIRELRCHHLFHVPCLDAWIGTGRASCPLCRGRVTWPVLADDGQAEVLFFRFCSFSGTSRRDRSQENWWLR